MSNRRVAAIIAVVVGTAVGIVAAKNALAGPTPVTATVVKAQQLAFPDVKLTLSLDSPRKTVSARPLYTRTASGRIDTTSPATRRSMAAYYLKPGDRISGHLFMSRSGGEVRWISNIKRVGTQRPIDRDQGIQSMKITTDRSSYPVGTTVKIQFTITNTGSVPKAYNFSSGQQFDLWVTHHDKEIWRWSRGMMFTQALTSFTLSPGESKVFAQQWKQQDNDGKQVPPNEYVVKGQLTTMGQRPQPVSASFYIVPATAPTLISALRQNPERYQGSLVYVSGVYYGWRAPQAIPGCDEAPPVTRSDWVLSDGKACIYVTGPSELDPIDDRGKSVVVQGEVRLTEKGQVYLRAQSVKAE